MVGNANEEFVLPERFRTKVLRRRGDGGARTPITESLSEMVQWLDRVRHEADTLRQQAIVHPESEPDLVEAATRPESDSLTTASPLQAGLGAAFAIGAIGHYVEPNRFVDGWILSRGHAFAVRAVAELLDVYADSEYRGGVHQNPRFLRGTDEPFKRDPRWRFATRLLALLADTTGAEYTEARAAAAEYRDGTRGQRALTSFLFRERTEWVDADLHSDVVLDGRLELDLACCLLAAALTTAGQAREFAARAHWRTWPEVDEVVPTMLASVGTGLAPLLVAWLDGEWYDNEDKHERLLAMVSELGTEETIRALTDRLSRRRVQSFLFAGAELFPRRTLRVLAETPPDLNAPAEIIGSRDRERDRAPHAQHLKHALALHANTYADMAREELPTLSPAARARVEAALDPHRDLPDALPESLPKVLISPPWVNRDTAAKPVIVKGLMPPAGVSVVWAEGEREEWAATRFRDQRRPNEPDDDAVIAAHLAVHSSNRAWQEIDGTWGLINFARFYCRAADELVRPLLEAGRQPLVGTRESWPRVYLARFEVLGLPMTRNAVGPDRLGMLQPFRSPEIAAFVAESFTQRKTGHAEAVRWLTRHADYATEQLLPAAVGEPGKSRQAAARTLRWLSDKNGTDVVAIAAQTYGNEAAAAIKALLASEGGEELPRTLPKVPRWAEPFALPQIALADGGSALPPDAVHHLGQMLALSAAGEPYSGIEVVKEICDAVSLREYAWALFENWRMAGYPSDFGWALTALRWFGDDEVVRRLAPLVRMWPGEGGHTRAVNGVEVFAAIGTDLALTTLSRLARRLKFKGLEDRAGEKIAEIAESLGLTAEQLADRVAPDLGLAADGTLMLDFGPRRFVAGFDAELKPFLRDEAGKPLKALPKPGADDDPELAKVATAGFSALKKEARTVVADQVARLEQAMVMQRRWTPEEFSAFFVRHPLMRHIARQVVWGTFDKQGTLAETFRVAEDLTFADLDDELFTPSEDAVIGLAHPLNLGPLVAKWSDVLADYQIRQPFAQLGRQPHALTDDERTSFVLERFADIDMPAGKVLGLTRRGWRRGDPWDDGYGHIERPLPDGRVVIANISPGIPVGYVSEAEDQCFAEIWISRDGQADHRPVPEWSDPFGTLDPVTASEILRDLTEVTVQ